MHSSGTRLSSESHRYPITCRRPRRRSHSSTRWQVRALSRHRSRDRVGLPANLVCCREFDWRPQWALPVPHFASFLPGIGYECLLWRHSCAHPPNTKKGRKKLQRPLFENQRLGSLSLQLTLFSPSEFRRNASSVVRSSCVTVSKCNQASVWKVRMFWTDRTFSIKFGELHSKTKGLFRSSPLKPHSAQKRCHKAHKSTWAYKAFAPKLGLIPRRKAQKSVSLPALNQPVRCVRGCSVCTQSSRATPRLQSQQALEGIRNNQLTSCRSRSSWFEMASPLFSLARGWRVGRAAGACARETPQSQWTAVSILLSSRKVKFRVGGFMLDNNRAIINQLPILLSNGTVVHLSSASVALFRRSLGITSGSCENSPQPPASTCALAVVGAGKPLHVWSRRVCPTGSHFHVEPWPGKPSLQPEVGSSVCWTVFSDITNEANVW